ncbi:hypothetical protein F5Y10DRAFT_262851 [Nemania abortiva]|nr:hypothetical protein F5Y10DRAFT_262851 [Nemania abortiva]
MSDPERSQFLISRPRVPTNEAARFVETRVVVSGQSDAVYSERRDSFVTLQQGKREEQISAEMWKQADKEKEELFDLIEQVQKKFEGKGDNRISDIELRRCKWDQVMVQVQETSRQWKSSPRRTSRAMQCIDKVGQNSEAFKSWLELLPAGDYGAIISGVFTIIIGAASRYTKVEDDIFQALAEIPEILEHSRRYVMIYADVRDSFLEKRTFDLFRSVLRTLSHIMRFFKDSTFRKFSESLLKQGSYKEELSQSLAELRKNSERIQEEANQCQAWRLLRQETMLRQTDQKADQGLHLLQSIYHFLLTSPMLTTNAEAQRVEGDALGRSLVSQAIATIAASPSSSAGEQNDFVRNRTGRRESAATKRALARDSMRKAYKLLTLLNYDPSATSGEVDSCLKLGEALNEDKKSRAVAMIQNARFREFMAEYLASSSLLINGRADVSSAEGLSPLSFVAAKLVRISERMDSSSGHPYVVKYFCNQHPPFLSGSAISPVVELMASFLGQLLAQMIEEEFDVDLSMLTKSHWQKIENSDLKTLYDVFRELTYQLPPKSVLICVIDELTRYEVAPFIKETDIIVKRLTRLALKHDEIVFKLLVTCEGRALDISKYFTNQTETVDLGAEVEPDESASWKISTMELNPIVQSVTVVPWNQIIGVHGFGADASLCIPNKNLPSYTVNVEQLSVPSFEQAYRDFSEFFAKYPGGRNSSAFLFQFVFDKADHATEAAAKALGHKVRAQFVATSGYNRLAVYNNYAGGEETLEDIYSAENLPRLTALKRQWDPRNLFKYQNPLPTQYPNN